VSERAREVLLAIVVVGVISAAVVVDFGPAAPSRPTSSGPKSPFLERAVYCPPLIDQPGYSGRIAVSGTAMEEPAVGLEPDEPEPQALASDEVRVEPMGSSALSVIGYGTPVAAGAGVSSTEEGSAAAGCTSEAADAWYFPAGTSEIGFDERLLIHNPFPDEAVVKVTLVTSAGERVKAGLADVPVPAGESREVRVNEFMVPRAEVGAIVTAIRGRVLTWKLVRVTAKELTQGVEMTLGSPVAARSWYFPAGAVGGGATATIWILNPNDSQARVNVAVAGRRAAGQPPRLLDLPVPPRSVRRIDVPRPPSSRDDATTGVGVSVASSNGVPVVVERTTSYSGGDGEGVATELGATQPARGWLLMPAEFKPRRDLIAVMNPTAADAVFTIAFRSTQGSENFEALRRRVGAGLRVEVPITRWTSRGATAAVVTSDAALVAERSSFAPGGDVADQMGVPIRPTGP
jgi:hypothetical protein